MFTHLHVHSHYSLLTAPAKIDDLLDQAKAYGMTALALTDNTALYGAIEFYTHAKEKGIKPIIGTQVNVCKDLHDRNNTGENRKRFDLVLLAENDTGYQNLMKIISIAHLEGFYYKPRVDKELLKKYHEGLIALSGSVTGEVASFVVQGNDQRAAAIAREYEEIFGKNNFYLEIQPHPNYENQVIANEGLIKISRATGIPLVATVDVHYIHPEDAEIQDILLCIQNNWKVSDTNRISLMHLDLSMRSPEVMGEIFRATPDALENTQKIADRCNVTIKLGQTLLPHFEVPGGLTAQEYLRELCEVGLVKRYDGKVEPKHRERMEYELSVIEKTGFASYFLIVQDYANWAKNNNVIVGPGRGSAAGSFVAYLTGITNMDPIEYNLLFERFLNPERISMPDVDMDFSDDRRDAVLNYVREKYGHDHVAQIITFGTMAARAAVRDTGRALGFPYSLCDQISKAIPMFCTIEKAFDEAPDFKHLYDTNPDARKVIDAARHLEGLARHASMHACGVVITDKPVTEYSPIQNVSGSREGVVTQYASSTKSSAVEKLGLLKMDFLGLKNLTIMQNTLRIVKALGKMPALCERLGLDPETALVSDIMDKLPLDDSETFKLLQDAHTTGVFQLESNGMKRYLKQLKPTILEDIIAMVALYRPGPMEWLPDFIDGKHGKKVKYLHPKLESILSNTYGVVVYQEQVMQIARDLAGFTMGEADVLRKAMGKKILALIQEQKIKFIDRAVGEGVARGVAEKVFTFIEPFAGYGFNRSHAACYALIGYQTAFLKAHYPAEFMAALLTSDQSSSDRIAIEVNECREMGVDVLPPSVNESFEDFAVIISLPAHSTQPHPDPLLSPGEGEMQEHIRFGLNAIKNVGKNASEEIVAERKRNGKFTSLGDFIERVQTKDLNKKSLEALAKVGALDEFDERATILASVDKILQHSKNTQRIKDTHHDSLFGSLPISNTTLTLSQAPPAIKKQKLQWEKELLGLYVSDHPVSEFKDYLEKVATTIHDADKLPDLSPIKVGGVIATVKKIMTKSDKPMFFAYLEDLTGRVEVIVFPRVAEATEAIWQPDTIVLVSGKVNKKDGSLKIMADGAERITPQSIETFQRVLATQHKHAPVQQPDRVAEPQGEYTTSVTPTDTCHCDPALREGRGWQSPTQNGKTDEKNNPESIEGTPSSKLILQLTDNLDSEFLRMLSTTLEQYPKGETRVFVRLHGQLIETAYQVTLTPDLCTQISQLSGVEKIER
ncbi:MAG: DNA polymerase III subunit alpha [Candidatus Moraniibacteriota bacterium]